MILYEKGVIWNYRQYDTVAAIAQLGALTFNIGRPGTGVGRVGGHQEGYARPDYPGPKPPPDVDKFVQDGNGKTLWIIGCNPYLSAQNNAYFRKRIGQRAQTLTDYLSLHKGEAGEPATMQALAARILDGLDNTGGTNPSDPAASGLVDSMEQTSRASPTMSSRSAASGSAC